MPFMRFCGSFVDEFERADNYPRCKLSVVCGARTGGLSRRTFEPCFALGADGFPGGAASVRCTTALGGGACLAGKGGAGCRLSALALTS